MKNTCDVTCFVTGIRYNIIKVYKDRGTTKMVYIDVGAGPKHNNKTTVYTKNIRDGVIYPDNYKG